LALFRLSNTASPRILPSVCGGLFVTVSRSSV
jgi:hypothetical protein